MLEKLFVYGSLRKKGYNHYYLEGKAKYLGTYYVSGELYTLKDKRYPALLDSDTEYSVGELYEVMDDFKEMDELEGYDEKNLKNNEYNRVVVEVYDKNMKKIDEAFMYKYNMDNAKNPERLGKKIEGNDYIS